MFMCLKKKLVSHWLRRSSYRTSLMNHTTSTHHNVSIVHRQSMNNKSLVLVNLWSLNVVINHI